jgi:hypothetical protein
VFVKVVSGSAASFLPMNPPAHTLLFFLRRRACHHTYSFPHCDVAPASTHIQSLSQEVSRQHTFSRVKNRIITRQHTHQYWLLHSKLSPEMPCKYLQPASTHLLLFRMHVSNPPAHMITPQDVIYTRQHTHLCVLNPSAHTEHWLISSVPRQRTYFQVHIR